jgi:hypothetical protein
MTRQTRVRFFLLVLLFGALAAIPVAPPQNAYAGTCCSGCDRRLERCLAGTLQPSCQGDPSCCDNWVQSCYSDCDGTC